METIIDNNIIHPSCPTAYEVSEAVLSDSNKIHSLSQTITSHEMSLVFKLKIFVQIKKDFITKGANMCKIC